MANFCLVPVLADKFKKDIIEGKIDPSKLNLMTSVERHNFFANMMGEDNATHVNALFESKLLLKNQQAGMITWAKTVIGISKPAQRDIISRIQRMDEILTPKDESVFLEDLASQKLGTNVSYEEAGKIAELSKKIDETKVQMEKGGDRMDYGRAVITLSNYINDLKAQANKFSLAELKQNPGGSVVKGVLSVAGTTKSLKATLDDSYIGRQGIKMMWTHPTVWFKNAKQSFVSAVKTFGGQAVMDEIKADIVSRPNYLNGNYKKMEIKLDTIEESFPTQLLEKIPIAGRLFKAADVAFTSQAYKSRADVADIFIKVAEQNNEDLSDPNQLLSIGKLVNSMTGRGYLGPIEPAANVVNVIFFSARFFKSNLDTLTVHAFDSNFSGFARKQAAFNFLKIILGTAAVLAIANVLKPGSVEKDPRSADFGKIKIGDTRFDVSGGMASIVTLASRLLTMSSKSSTTKKITKLNSDKFGAQTGMDVLYTFFENKLSPAASVLKDIFKGHDYQGNKPTISGEASNLLTPLSIVTYMELKNDRKSANIFWSMIADGLGFGTNTYPNKKPKKK